MQRSITDAMTQFADKNKLREFGTELGRPALHADIQDGKLTFFFHSQYFSSFESSEPLLTIQCLVFEL